MNRRVTVEICVFDVDFSPVDRLHSIRDITKVGTSTVAPRSQSPVVRDG
jgi:hypothetical protein